MGEAELDLIITHRCDSPVDVVIVAVVILSLDLCDIDSKKI